MFFEIFREERILEFALFGDLWVNLVGKYLLMFMKREIDGNIEIVECLG